MPESLQSYKSPQDVYARYLISHRGYPLWIPEPNGQLPDDYLDDGLRIGDVGVVAEDGSFDLLFNICLPPDHPLHDGYGYGVPDGFEPITLRKSDVATVRFAEDPGCVISTSSVTQMEVNPVKGRSDYRFSLSSSEGALLILPQGASRHSLRNYRVVGEYAAKHAPEWYKFARDAAGRQISNDSLYLITGFFKARSWSLASFQGAQGTGDIPAHFQVTQVEDGNIVGAYTWSTTRAIDKRVGPTEYNGKANQAVYISGFRVAVTDEALGRKRIAVTTGVPSDKTHHEEFINIIEESEDLSEHASSESTRTDQSSSQGVQRTIGHVSMQHIPHRLSPFHPSDIINRYLLRSDRSARVAITHDSQWTTLLENGRLHIQDFAEEGHLERILSDEYVVISQDRTVYLKNVTSASDIWSTHDVNPLTSNFFDNPYRDVFEDSMWALAEDGKLLEIRSSSLLSSSKHHTLSVPQDTIYTSIMAIEDSMLYIEPDQVHKPTGTMNVTDVECAWGTNNPCGQRFPDFDGLISHLRHAHDINGNAGRKITCLWKSDLGVCARTYRRDGFRRHIGTHVGISFICPHCGTHYARMDTLLNHTRIAHSTEK